MLVEHLFGGFITRLTILLVHKPDTFLEVVVGTFEHLVFFALVADRKDQFLLHFGGGGEITDTFAEFIIILIKVFTVFVTIEFGRILRGRVLRTGARFRA